MFIGHMIWDGTKTLVGDKTYDEIGINDDEDDEDDDK